MAAYFGFFSPLAQYLHYIHLDNLIWKGRKMNRRKTAIQVIIAEVAQEGKAGKCAIRDYIETRLSKTSFNKACEMGQAIYNQNQSNEQENNTNK